MKREAEEDIKAEWPGRHALARLAGEIKGAGLREEALEELF